MRCRDAIMSGTSMARVIGSLFFLVPTFAQFDSCFAAALDDIRGKASLLPGAIQSYEFTVESITRSGSKSLHKDKVTFRQSGSSLRADCEDLDRTSLPRKVPVSKVVAAYNGSRYQIFYDDIKTLTFSNNCRFPNPYWLPNPLILPYLWMMYPGSMNWSDLKNQEVWIKKFSAANYEGETTENSVTSEVVSMPYGSQDSGMRVKIYFAKTLGYYPLKCLGYGSDGKQLLSVIVTKYKTIDCDGEKVVFPLVVTSTEEDAHVTTIQEWRIEEGSIKVNQPIDEDVFTLSPAMAKFVDDFDKNIQNQKGVGTSGDSLPPPSRWRAWFLGVNVVVVVLLVAFFSYRWVLRRSR